MPQAENIANQNSYSDIDFSFQANPNTGDVGIMYDTEAVRQSVKNILMTNYGEKLFKPDFGVNLRRFLFEPFDASTYEAIREEVFVAIQNYEPRVRVEQVDITPLPNILELRIKVYFTVLTPEESSSDVTIVVERIR